MRTALLALLAATQLVPAADRWEMQYFYDQDRSSLSLADIGFSSPLRGLAVGTLHEGDDSRAVALVTADGGANWTQVRMPRQAISLFVLDDAAAWVAAEDGIWFSDEGGRTWRKIRNQRGLVAVHFVNRLRGWAVGYPKKAIETRDGGKTWTDLPAAATPKVSAANSAYESIAFWGTLRGTIVGRSVPPEREHRLPLWMETRPQRRRQLPSLSVLLDTTDGGATWRASTSSMFGRISTISFRPDGSGLALVEFDEYFEFPSEIFRMGPGGLVRSLRMRDRAITDIACRAGEDFASGFEPVGQLARSPIPGKVVVLRMRETDKWEQMPVDYRAVATRVRIALLETGEAWVATDTGMILRLRRDAP